MQAPEVSVRHLLTFQQHDGSFDIPSDELTLLRSDFLTALRYVERKVIEVTTQFPLTANGLRRTAHTIVIIVILEDRYTTCWTLWQLMVLKATAYLRSMLHDTFDAVMQVARQFLDGIPILWRQMVSPPPNVALVQTSVVCDAADERTSDEAQIPPFGSFVVSNTPMAQPDSRPSIHAETDALAQTETLSTAQTLSAAPTAVASAKVVQGPGDRSGQQSEQEVRGKVTSGLAESQPPTIPGGQPTRDRRVSLEIAPWDDE